MENILASADPVKTATLTGAAHRLVSHFADPETDRAIERRHPELSFCMVEFAIHSSLSEKIKKEATRISPWPAASAGEFTRIFF